MRILIMTAITAVALPFMALSQTTEEPQQTQGQTKGRKLLHRRKGKKCVPQRMRNAQVKPETATKRTRTNKR